MNIKSNVTGKYLSFSVHAVGRLNFDLNLKLRQEKEVNFKLILFSIILLIYCSE